MSTRPRTPRHYPKMKPRGRRVKALLAQRTRSIFMLPHAIIERGDSYVIATARSEGGHRVMFETWTNGYGLRVPKPRAESRMLPEPDPDGTLPVNPLDTSHPSSGTSQLMFAPWGTPPPTTSSLNGWTELGALTTDEQ